MMKQILFLILVLFLFSNSVNAGEKSSITGISLSGTTVANTGGIDAIGLNPARLVRFDRPREIDEIEYTISHDSINSARKRIQIEHDTTIFVPEKLPNFTMTLIPAFSFNLGTDFINYDIYSKYFTGTGATGINGKKIGKKLTNNDKEEILKLFPSGLAETHIDFETRLFGLTIHNNFLGSFGFTLTERFNLNFNMPKAYLQLPLYGLDSNGITYDLNGTTIKAQEIREMAFSYAREINGIPYIKDFAAGFSVKILQGLFHFDLDKYDVQFGNKTTIDGNGQPGIDLFGKANIHYYASMASVFDSGKKFTPFPQDAGKGLAFDFGTSFNAYDDITVAFSITDIGSMKWNRNVIEGNLRSHFRINNITSQDQLDSIDAFTKSLQDSISNLRGDTISSFNSELPTSLQFGAAFRYNVPYFGNVLFAMQYKQGFNNALGNSKRAKISFATEYRPLNFIPLRMGISFGGKDRFNISGGLGFDFYHFEWDIGSENIGFLFIPKAFHQFSFGTGMRLRF